MKIKINIRTNILYILGILIACHILLDRLFLGLRSGSRWKGTSGIKQLLFTILSFVLFVVCTLFVFLVSILVLPGISFHLLGYYLCLYT